MPLAAARDPRYRTKQQFVYRTLRDAILRCELRPGERLVIDDLARRLEVSAIPIREALQLLQSEGLVVNVPHVGATVAPISPESIHEAFSIMEGLEAVATRIAVSRMGPEDDRALAQHVAAMDAALAGGDHEEWSESNTRFHLSICRLAGMPLLEEMTERVLGRWDRIRRYYFSGVLVHRAEQAQREHHAIAEALRGRDAAAVERLVREHNLGALRSYTDYLQHGAQS
jgi:DNA-binding GntR family transcriptional regulator